MALESRLTDRIIKRLRQMPEADVLKLHGSPFQRAGYPDIHVCWQGRCYWLEVKRPGEGPTKLQQHRLVALRKARAVAEVVRSVAEAERLLRRNS